MRNVALVGAEGPGAWLEAVMATDLDADTKAVAVELASRAEPERDAFGRTVGWVVSLEDG